MFIFGSNLTTILENTTSFLQFNLSRNATYLVYPDTVGAIKGSVNLTMANFGEALYLFGKDYYYIFEIITGIILGLSVKYMFYVRGRKVVVYNSLVSTYFIVVILQWVIGGGVGNLISIPNIVYFLLSFLVLKLILKGTEVS